LTNKDQARGDFELARDDDALDFRADTRINSAIKEAASRMRGKVSFCWMQPAPWRKAPRTEFPD